VIMAAEDYLSYYINHLLSVYRKGQNANETVLRLPWFTFLSSWLILFYASKLQKV
jgi:hypothetical protein